MRGRIQAAGKGRAIRNHWGKDKKMEEGEGAKPNVEKPREEKPSLSQK